MTEVEKLRALLAEARDYVKPIAPCSDAAPCGHFRCEVLQRIDAALAEPGADDYKRGAEAMREAAAKEVFAFYGWSKDNETTRTDIKNLAELIDDLPLPEDEP